MSKATRVILAASAAAFVLSGLSACDEATAAAPAQAAASAEPTLADLEAIEATLYRYTRGLDRGDPQMYASAFTETGELRSGDNVLASGRAALGEVVAGVAERRQAAIDAGEPARQLYHMDANSRIEFLDAEHAVHHAYYLTLSQTGAGAGSAIAVEAIGSTEDELTKVGGEWLITTRRIITGP